MQRDYIYLPEKQLCYSPIQVKNWLNDAVIEENGDAEKIFKNKQKYKNLVECWHASILALALKKQLSLEFLLCPSDNPDIHFLNKNGANTDQQEGFQVEVRELFDFKEEYFDDNYETLVEEIWKTKGTKQYGKCQLLLASRLITKGFKLKKFTDLINNKKYIWNFEKIILSIYTEKDKEWTFFEIFPCPHYPTIGKASFNLRTDSQYWY